ncbi:MAG: LysM peptidoglycan-binding domain-containing protein [Cohaesibacter sp.]|nr:LysM peptidoglycan-binding domain-containing protein [Cohaesibacter sp.]
MASLDGRKGMRDAKYGSAMKNNNLVVTIVVLIVGAILAWFGFGDKLAQQSKDAVTQDVAQTTTASDISENGKAAKATEQAENPASDAKASKTEAQTDPAKTEPPEVASKTDEASADAKVASNASEQTTDTDALKTDSMKAPESAQTQEASTSQPSESSEASGQSKESGQKDPSEELAVPASDDKAQSAKDTSSSSDVSEQDANSDQMAPTFDVVRVEPDGSTLVAGKALPGSVVELLDGEQVLASVTADESGNWILILEEALRKGVHDLRLASKAQENGEQILSKSSIAVAIPENGDLLVVESEPGQASKILAQIGQKAAEQDASQADQTANKAAGEMADTKPSSENVSEENKETQSEAAPDAAAKEAEPKEMASKKESADAADGTADGSQSAQSGTDSAPVSGADTDGTVKQDAVEASVSVKAIELEGDILYVAGDAKPAGSVLRLYVDNRPISDSKISDAGTFLFDGPIALDVGSHDVRVDLLDEAGNKVLKRAQVRFEKKAASVAANNTTTAGEAGGDTTTASSSSAEQKTQQGSANRKVIIRRGDNLWEIARRVYGAGYRYSTIYDVNTDQIRDPHWIYPGQVFTLPVGEAGWEQNFDAVDAPDNSETNSQ